VILFKWNLSFLWTKVSIFLRSLFSGWSFSNETYLFCEQRFQFFFEVCFPGQFLRFLNTNYFFQVVFFGTYYLDFIINLWQDLYFSFWRPNRLFLVLILLVAFEVHGSMLVHFIRWRIISLRKVSKQYFELFFARPRVAIFGPDFLMNNSLFHREAIALGLILFSAFNRRLFVIIALNFNILNLILLTIW